MTKSLIILLSAACIIILTGSCRLTRADVIGTWKSHQKDTLYILSNNEFKLKKANDSVAIGTWELRKTVLALSFADSLQGFGRGCNVYQYMWLKGPKTSLVRNIDCPKPSNRFRSIEKIN